jgi:hypothetical protein
MPSYPIIRNQDGIAFHPGTTCININYFTPGSSTAEEEIHRYFSYKVTLSQDGSFLILEPRPNPSPAFQFGVPLTEANAKHLHIYQEAVEIAPEKNQQRWYKALENRWVVWASRDDEGGMMLMAHNILGGQVRCISKDFVGTRMLDGINEAMWHSLMNRLGLEE